MTIDQALGILQQTTGTPSGPSSRRWRRGMEQRDWTIAWIIIILAFLIIYLEKLF